MKPTLSAVISRYGAETKAKLANPSASGEPEDQLRAPLETLFADLTELCGMPRAAIAAVGESSIASLKTRPDYAITLRNILVGFVEVKAPGKGADPRKFKGHDKEQWEKLQSLPNLLYTDGNDFSLWRNGELAGSIVSVKGNVESSGKALAATEEFVAVFDNFLRWEPIPPKSAQDLAKVSARLCRLLRDEVTEQLDHGSTALTALAKDWRALLFPEANNQQFADGYAQAVTFGLLMARARDIRLAGGLDSVGKQLSKTNSLIGTALKLLTDDATNEQALKTSLGTLTRVLDAVNWHTISKDSADAWLYFYEEFLGVYDNALRKLTGSYYTPPEVVGAMVRLVDDVLRSRFEQPAGLASSAVTLADPAVGTGTFLLGVLKQIAAAVEADQGEGAVPEAIEAAISRLIAFEMQLGPFAVAQLRIHAELLHLIGRVPRTPVRMYVTNTLDNPYIEQIYLPLMVEPIAASRRQANEIKKTERITVVLGNPPYKEKAKGLGGWVEPGNAHSGNPALLEAWMPPADWGVGAHGKHLRNLYIYFWRWATWKVFDHDPNANTGVVCFITVAGFLNGPGFQRMRDYLRRTADGIWVIDCSPEGHQPDVPTRIFQGVQQPVCIVLVARSKSKSADKPAPIKYTALPVGKREAKFEALANLPLDGSGWQDCSTDWRAPFLPAATGDWATYPALDDLFAYNGSGVMPGRTWVIAPDAESLEGALAEAHPGQAGREGSVISSPPSLPPKAKQHRSPASSPTKSSVASPLVPKAQRALERVLAHRSELPLGSQAPAAPGEQRGRVRLGGAFLINLDRIRPDPSQPRTVFNAAALNELATSIGRLGVVQPISVRYIPADDIYQIISGERRFQASKLAGLSTIPAVIANPDENEILVRQLVENWHRQDLNPFDLADSLVQLRDANKYSQRQLADVMGKSESEVSKLLKLLDLAPDIQKQERARLDKALSFKHLYEIARLLPDEQVVVVAAAREQKLTAAQTGKLVSHTIQRRSLAPKRGAPITRVQYVTTKARISIVFRKQSVTNDEILAALDEARDKARPIKEKLNIERVK